MGKKRIFNDFRHDRRHFRRGICDKSRENCHKPREVYDKGREVCSKSRDTWNNSRDVLGKAHAIWNNSREVYDKPRDTCGNSHVLFEQISRDLWQTSRHLLRGGCCKDVTPTALDAACLIFRVKTTICWSPNCANLHSTKICLGSFENRLSIQSKLEYHRDNGEPSPSLVVLVAINSNYHLEI